MCALKPNVYVNHGNNGIAKSMLWQNVTLVVVRKWYAAHL